MAQYAKKPETVEAWKVGSNPVPEWINTPTIRKKQTDDGRKYTVVLTGDGILIAETGDYIITDDGQFSVMSGARFDKIYRPDGANTRE
jgi:hypothetical protein